MKWIPLACLALLAGCASPTGRPMIQMDALKIAYDAGILKGVIDARCVKPEKLPPVRVIGQDGKEVYAEIPVGPPLVDSKTCTLLRAWHAKLKGSADAFLLEPSKLDIEQILRLAGAAAL